MVPWLGASSPPVRHWRGSRRWGGVSSSTESSEEGCFIESRRGGTLARSNFRRMKGSSELKPQECRRVDQPCIDKLFIISNPSPSSTNISSHCFIFHDRNHLRFRPLPECSYLPIEEEESNSFKDRQFYASRGCKISEKDLLFQEIGYLITDKVRRFDRLSL